MKRPLLEGAAIAAIAGALAAAWYLWVGDVDLNLADEGFLWHGVQRTLAGEVPKRDFQAYDPGRYYLCAAWCGLFGDGILALRAGLAAVQALGLLFGLLVLRRVAALPWLVPLGAVLLGWMFPQHKVFEPAFAMAAVWAGVRLLERPSAARHLQAGAVVGLGACVGINLALYGGAGLALVVAYRAWKGERVGLARRVGGFALGGVLGYAPVLLLVAFVPGYAASFVETLQRIAAAGTNVPLAYPWPWRVDLAGLHGLALASRVAVVLAFLLPALAYPLGLWIAARARADDVARRAVPIAAALVGLPFVHHVSVRSDPPHLAQVLHPVLILLLAAPALLERSALRRAALAVLWLGVGLVSALAVHDAHPSLVGLHAWREDVKLRPLDVAGDRLRLPPWTFAIVRSFQVVTRAHVPEGAPMLIAPFSPTLYPASGRASPVHTTYFLWKADRFEEEKAIEDLSRAGVEWAWVTAGGMDGDPERALDRTHPLLWRYLTARFEPVEDPRIPPGSYLLRRRRPEQR